MKRRIAAALVALIGVAQAHATDAPSKSERLRGTIAAYVPASHQFTLKTDKGDAVLILAPETHIVANKPIKLSDIGAGDFVASAALQGPDGKLYAEELRVFPDSMRGMGEGQYPMQAPKESMTNATVEQVQGTSLANDSGTLSLSFHGSAKDAAGDCTGHATAPGQGSCTGTTAIVIRPGIPVTRWIPGEPSWLAPGKDAFAQATVAPDGTLTARLVLVEHDGVKPKL